MLNFTPAILRNLTGKKATRLHPKVKRPPFAKARGKISIEVKDCIFCSKCATKCPTNCITVDKKKGTWELDPMTCVYCGICVQTCPTHCLSQENTPHFPVSEKFIQKADRPPKTKKPSSVDSVRESKKIP